MLSKGENEIEAPNIRQFEATFSILISGSEIVKDSEWSIDKSVIYTAAAGHISAHFYDNIFC